MTEPLAHQVLRLYVELDSTGLLDHREHIGHPDRVAWRMHPATWHDLQVDEEVDTRHLITPSRKSVPTVEGEVMYLLMNQVVVLDEDLGEGEISLRWEVGSTSSSSPRPSSAP